MRTLQLRHLDVASPVHRMGAEAKIVGLACLSTAVAFNPAWPALAIGWGFAAVVFLAARLPIAVLAPPNRAVLVPLGIAAVLSLLSGGDPRIAGLELGGMVEFAQFVVFGFLLIALAALLAWTTSLTDVALGLGRLLGPLRHLRLPADEVATAVVLAVRALPTVRAEFATVADARRTRPVAPNGAGGRRGNATLNDAIDFGAAVVVGTHRRAHDLGRAMVARNSTRAPASDRPPVHLRDVVGVLLAIAVGAVILRLG